MPAFARQADDIGRIEGIEGQPQAEPDGFRRGLLGDPEGKESRTPPGLRQRIEVLAFRRRHGALRYACGQVPVSFHVHADVVIAPQCDQDEPCRGAEIDAQARTGSGRRKFRLAGLRAIVVKRLEGQVRVAGKDGSLAGVGSGGRGRLERPDVRLGRVQRRTLRRSLPAGAQRAAAVRAVGVFAKWAVCSARSWSHVRPAGSVTSA